MDYLDLTNSFLIETGIGDPVQTLEDQGDDIMQAAHWINAAWAAFQRKRLWPFRKVEGSLPVTAGATSYTFTSLSLSSGALIVPHSFYSPLGGVRHVDYERVRAARRSGQNTDPSRVQLIAVHNEAFHTYPVVNNAQSIAFDYWRAVQTLRKQADIPYGLPSDFHMMLVHLAIAHYGVLAGGQEGANLYAHHAKLFNAALTEYMTFVGVTASSEVPPVTHTLIR